MILRKGEVMRTLSRSGFTLVELMIVVAIIAFLAMIAIPSLMRFSAKAKRSEAYIHLGSLAAAEKAYWIEHGTYTDKLAELSWKPEGATTYTYGFAGQEGINFIPGKTTNAASALQGVTKADQTGFVAAASADIDGDGTMDVITVNDKHEFTIATDDLA